MSVSSGLQPGQLAVLSQGWPLHDICRELTSSPLLGAHLRAIIWIGSKSAERDVHAGSDIDLQLFLDRPNIDTMREVASVLTKFPNVDLSVMYEGDLWDEDGNVDFQDGTKGAFFLHVLAGGTILYGDPVYAAAIDHIDARQLRESFIFTIREYLSRLRVMAMQKETTAFEFKKYAVKLLRDALAVTGGIDMGDMVSLDNAAVIAKARTDFGLDRWCGESAVAALCDYSDRPTPAEKALVLLALEHVAALARRA